MASVGGNGFSGDSFTPLPSAPGGPKEPAQTPKQQVPVENLLVKINLAKAFLNRGESELRAQSKIIGDDGVTMALQLRNVKNLTYAGNREFRATFDGNKPYINGVRLDNIEKFAKAEEALQSQSKASGKNLAAAITPNDAAEQAAAAASAVQPNIKQLPNGFEAFQQIDYGDEPPPLYEDAAPPKYDNAAQSAATPSKNVSAANAAKLKVPDLGGLRAGGFRDTVIRTLTESMQKHGGFTQDHLESAAESFFLAFYGTSSSQDRVKLLDNFEYEIPNNANLTKSLRDYLGNAIDYSNKHSAAQVAAPKPVVKDSIDLPPNTKYGDQLRQIYKNFTNPPNNNFNDFVKAQRFLEKVILSNVPWEDVKTWAGGESGLKTFIIAKLRDYLNKEQIKSDALMVNLQQALDSVSFAAKPVRQAFSSQGASNVGRRIVHSAADFGIEASQKEEVFKIPMPKDIGSGLRYNTYMKFGELLIQNRYDPQVIKDALGKLEAIMQKNTDFTIIQLHFNNSLKDGAQKNSEAMFKLFYQAMEATGAWRPAPEASASASAAAPVQQKDPNILSDVEIKVFRDAYFKALDDLTKAHNESNPKPKKIYDGSFVANYSRVINRDLYDHNNARALSDAVQRTQRRWYGEGKDKDLVLQQILTNANKTAWAATHAERERNLKKESAAPSSSAASAAAAPKAKENEELSEAELQAQAEFQAIIRSGEDLSQAQVQSIAKEMTGTIRTLIQKHNSTEGSTPYQDSQIEFLIKSINSKMKILRSSLAVTKAIIDIRREFSEGDQVLGNIIDKAAAAGIRTIGREK